jgi:pimeloyl-ACP methyl ester carboxylesterase
MMVMSETSPGKVKRLNGVDLYFEVHGSGEPVLLLHGFGGCSQDWHALSGGWPEGFARVTPDMRGHGQSSLGDGEDLAPSAPGTGKEMAFFRHRDAAKDMFALLDHLGIGKFKGVGVSGGGNVLLHMATEQPERVEAMVLVSATSYFPAQARVIMRQYGQNLSEAEREAFRRRHPGGDAQIGQLLASTRAFADSYDDMNFTPAYLSTITARTLIVQGDRDPLYPAEISVEMAKAIPKSSLWIVPNAGHGPIGGERWAEFAKTAEGFLKQ